MLGWFGSLLLATCSIPQAYKSYKDGHSDGIDNTFLATWLIGEVLTLYAVASTIHTGYLIFNYIANIIFLLVILRYKIWKR